MAPATLTVLGGFELRLSSGILVTLPTRKAQALLAYLALPAGRRHQRDKLASLLWGGLQEPQARASLRQAVYALRKALGESAIRVDRAGLALATGAVRADVHLLEEGARQGTPEAFETASCQYRGDLLAGLALGEPPFEEWLIAERERLRELALEALARLLAHHRAAGRLEAAVESALRLLAIDPLQEAVHRTLMRLYTALGRRAAALRQYQACVSALARELQTEPEAETKLLYQAILRERTRASGQPADAPRAQNTERDPGAGPEAAAEAETPLIGRQREMTRLTDALARAEAGHGRLVAVVGAAGIGKSRLVAEVTTVARARGFRVLLGHCYETERILPFAPWIDALRTGRLAQDQALLGALPAPSRSALARLMPELGPVEGSAGQTDLAHLFDAVARLVERLAAEGALVLVLEDIHWGDELSVRLLVSLARRMTMSRVLVLVTYREEETASVPLMSAGERLVRERIAGQIALPPLSREDTAELTRRLARPGTRPDVVAALEAQVWATSEGSPFVAVETMHALREDRLQPDPGALPLSARVHLFVTNRLDRLGERSRRLVAIAALIGRRFDFTLLQRAADMSEEDAAEGVEELVRHRILHQSGDGFEFVHDHIRQVAQTHVAPLRRGLLHRKIAEALETLAGPGAGEHALALGTHYRRAEVWPKAVRYLAEAGARAAVRSAHREAALCLEDALAALEHLPPGLDEAGQAARLHADLGRVLHLLPDLGRATESFVRAEVLARAVGDDRTVAHCCVGLGFVRASAGEHDAAVEASERALRIASSLGDLRLQVWAGVSAARAHDALGRYRESAAHSRRVIALLERLGQDGGLARSAIDTRYSPGGLFPSVASRTWLALSLAELGEFDEAAASGEAGLAAATSLEDGREAVWASYCLGSLWVRRGEPDRAIAVQEQHLPLCRQESFVVLFPRFATSLGSAYAMAGRLEAGLRLLEDASKAAADARIAYGAARLETARAEALFLAGRLDHARRAGLQALEAARGRAERGDEAWALRLLADIAATGTRPDVGEAGARFEAALALAQSLGMRPLAARCHLGLARLYGPLGRQDAATTHGGRAASMFEQMGMARWLALARAPSAS